MERDGYGPGETSELKRGNGQKKRRIFYFQNKDKREKKPASSGKTQDARVDNNFYKLRLNPKETSFFGQQIFAIMQHPHERRSPTPEISFQGIFPNIMPPWEIPNSWATLRPYAEDHDLVHRQPIQERPPPSLSNLLQHSFGQYPSLPEIQPEEISAEAVQHAHEMLHRYGPRHLPSPSRDLPVHALLDIVKQVRPQPCHAPQAPRRRRNRQRASNQRPQDQLLTLECSSEYLTLQFEKNGTVNIYGDDGQASQ
uniref:Uncharacterized protein n=1 Tax=Plectus sambesii TaxID=2011161 RepID=A0A914VAT1_9BILA